MRPIPNVPLSPCSPDYARLVAQGWDYWQEALRLVPSTAFLAELERCRVAAQALRADASATVEIELNGQRFQVHATGARGGFLYRLSCDDFQILIGSPKREWTISVRHLAAGLWEHGPAALRIRAFDALRPYTSQLDSDAIRVSRVDYCFDFYSPSFTKEFKPAMSGNVVAHSEVKTHEIVHVYSTGGRGKTLTIGARGGLQVQCYDKTTEIDEASGKTWLYDVWAAGMDGEWPWQGRPRDLWRLECRFSSAFLKERNVRRPHEVESALSNLIAEALFCRRLCVPCDDSNRRRWAVHPLWSAALEARGAVSLLPVGRKITGRRRELRERAIAQIAGSIRSATVLAFGAHEEGRSRALALEAHRRVGADPRHRDKEAAAQARYSTIDDAQ